MADWKQITARIRRARTGKDPAAQLANLFEKTRDAMVAFELGKFCEAGGQATEAAKWYGTAAERFRRADWKAKAHEAIARLGGAVPAESNHVPSQEAEADSAAPIVTPEPIVAIEQNPAALESMMAVSSEIQAASEADPAAGEAPRTRGGRRRRGRRGGRNRHHGSRELTGQSAPASVSPPPAAPADLKPEEPGTFERTRHREIPSFPVEPAVDRAEPFVRGRFGDPGLSSRSSLLEMQLRRLLTCPPVRLDQADKAPVGPGVLVLTDDEMTTYYYVEACDTLRVAIAHLTRAGSGRKGNPSLKPQLAEHLGIAEARAGKYLADHCVVRWLQLDEGAGYLAHYAIAVLRPILDQ
jgi:hypothetical protein